LLFAILAEPTTFFQLGAARPSHCYTLAKRVLDPLFLISYHFLLLKSPFYRSLSRRFPRQKGFFPPLGSSSLVCPLLAFTKAERSFFFVILSDGVTGPGDGSPAGNAGASGPPMREVKACHRPKNFFTSFSDFTALCGTLSRGRAAFNQARKKFAF